MSLKIADGLTLPLSVVTEPLGILAVRRAGKSNAAVVIAEEMYRNHLHWVAIDPKGDWWGIRSSSDGRGAGLPIPIFGGRHGDVPLEPGAGAVIADLIVDQTITCVLDVSGFSSEAEKIRFLLAFSERLFRRKDETQEPTHVFFEEADDYIPQRAFPEQQRLVHSMARILKQGGSRGLGGTIISQRSAVVNKDVLTQIQTLFALRTTSPQDRKAIQDWVSFNGENVGIVSTLHELHDGEAWVWSPNWLRKTARVQFNRRKTFDSGSTPKGGGKKVQPATLADIDLGAIKNRMADTIERAKAEDPRELRKQIADLKTQLTKRPEAQQQIVEVPVVSASQSSDLLRTVELARRMLSDLVRDMDINTKAVVSDVDVKMQAALSAVSGPLSGMSARPRHAATPTPQIKYHAPERSHIAATNGHAMSTGKFKAMLIALAQAGRSLADNQIAARAGMALSGTFDKYLGQQRTAGYVVGSRDALTLTPDGLKSLGHFEPLPVGRDLQSYWLNKVGGGKKREMLAALIDAYPKPLDDQELSRRADMALSGTFDKYLGQLKTLQLVTGSRRALVASEELF